MPSSPAWECAQAGELGSKSTHIEPKLERRAGFRPYASSVNLAAGAPLWPDEWTGVGTVLLAIVTLGAILSTIFITRQDRKRADKRFADEQARHKTEVDEERRLAEARLKAQQEQSENHFSTEQWRITEREQYSEAYAVQVTVGELNTASEPPDQFGDPGSDAAKRLAALVVNRGRYGITRVSAQFSPDGKSLTSPSRSVRIPASFDSLPRELRGEFGSLRDKRGHGDTLAPWDAGMRFESANTGVRHLAGPYFVVRWVDRWGTNWEHKQGVVEPVAEGQSWKP